MESASRDCDGITGNDVVIKLP